MASFEPRRSQLIMRLPVDQVPVTLTLHDGERIDGTVFVPPGERLPQLLAGGDPFLPVALVSAVRLVARAAIACITVPVLGNEPEPELPQEKQLATVRLRCGVTLEGELRWTPPEEHRRTADHLNDDSPHVVVHEAAQTSYVAKAHIAWVEER